jgi:hypothetical protein
MRLRRRLGIAVAFAFVLGLMLGMVAGDRDLAVNPPTGAVLVTATTGPKQDPGFQACRQLADMAHAGAIPSDAQKTQAWTDFQASQHQDLRHAGEVLEQAPTGNHEYEAYLDASNVCAAHGIEVQP